jgi:hypothetical protein
VACASASTCAACPPGLTGDGRTCAPCALRVVVTPSFLGGAAPRAADATLSGVVSAADAACNTAGGWTFAWSTNATGSGGSAPLALDAATNGAAGPSLRLPARSLASGQTASFTLTACLAAAPTACGAATLAFPVTASPLVALLGGGGGLVGETPVMLSGASSYDPDSVGATSAGLSYAWSCVAVADSGPCVSPSGELVVLGAAPTQTLTLRGGGGEGAVYRIALAVAQGERASAANTTLTVKPGLLPLVSIAGSAALAPGAKADPSAQLVLQANATAFVPGAVATRWAMVAQSPPPAGGALLDLSDPSVAATPVTSVSMVVRAGALAPGTRYTFALTATDAAGRVGQANASVATSSAPRGGGVYVTPDVGEALSTPFSLVATGWTADADELPLSYAAEYLLGDASAPVSLVAYQASPSISVQLPAGLAAAGNVVTLRLSVRSAFGAVVAVNASAVVTWRVFASASEASAFVGDATARAEAALQSGDASSALQVVGGLAALLNSAAASSGAGGSGEDAAAAAAAAAQRASLLSVVAGALTQSAGALAAPAAVESTAALVSSLLSTPGQLSSAGAATALGVLGALAGAGAAVSPAAAQSVASALSSVALAPSSGGGGSSSSSNFGAVLGVLDSLASSQASGLQVPGQAPATVSTPVIQMSVAFNDGGADSPLFSAPLSAPGSNSSFDPLPAGALAAAGGAPVASTFLSLAFDAHAGGASNNTGGVTRLAFASAAGAAVPVADLAAPLLFTLPASTLRAGQQASCAWWDATVGAYSAEGCAALPSPTPPAHKLAFTPGFVVGAAGAASMAMAWNISGPLLDGCTVAFLDCTNATERASGALQLDPVTPAAAPVVTCGNASNLVLRAYVGAACPLRDAANAASCAWDVLQQTFTGAGCEAATETRCMCRHLTDFTSSPQPNIPVCSAADLFGLNPADLVTELRLLFIVVISLFGVMNIGAALGFFMDARERRLVVERLCDARCGFRVAADTYNGEDTGHGALLWRFGLDELRDELAAPSGPGVQLSAVMGLPWARLRAAMPDEWFGTRFGDALGRRHGFSAAGFAEAAALHDDLLKPPQRRKTAKLTPSLSRAYSMANANYAGVDTEALEEMIGTALVLSFLQVTQLMQVVQVAAHRAAAAAHFDAVRTPSGQDFDTIANTCLTLLAPDVLNGRTRWHGPAATRLPSCRCYLSALRLELTFCVARAHLSSGGRARACSASSSRSRRTGGGTCPKRSRLRSRRAPRRSWLSCAPARGSARRSGCSRCWAARRSC